MASGFEDRRPAPLDKAAQSRRTSHDPEPRRVKLRVGPAGRVVIPADIRARMRIKEGDVLIGELAGEELRMIGLSAAIERAQAQVRQAVPEGTGLVDEFLRERRSLWGEGE